MLEEKGVSGKVWEGEEAGCEEVGRVQRTRGRYDQEDRRFISNMIFLCQVSAVTPELKFPSKWRYKKTYGRIPTKWDTL